MTETSRVADGAARSSTSSSQVSIEKKNRDSSPEIRDDFHTSPHETKAEEPSSEDSKDLEEITRIDTSDYPHGVKLAFIIVALVLSIFLVALDMTIVATAIPRITDEFHSLNQVGWYGSAFFLTLGAFQSTWGKAYKYFPLKPTFLIAIAIFEVGSLICGVAQNSTTLIIGRAIAGKSLLARLLAWHLTLSRYGRSWYWFWRVHPHRVRSATGSKTCIHWPSRSLIWNCKCYRPSAWRSIHFPRHLAMVLLCQPTYWWCLRCRHRSFLPCAGSFETRQGSIDREAPANGSFGNFHYHGSDCVLSACNPMGWRDQSVERFVGHRDTCRLWLAPDSLGNCRVVDGRPSGLAGCASSQTGYTGQLLVQFFVGGYFSHR